MLENRPATATFPRGRNHGNGTVPPLKPCKVCGCPVGYSPTRTETLCLQCYAWAVRVTAVHVALELMGWND